MSMYSSGQAKSYFGGVFSPLAQYPGSGYVRAWQQNPAGGSLSFLTPTEQDRSRTTYCMSIPLQPLSLDLAFLLVDTDAKAAVDRRALREAGVSQVRVLTSGIAAVRELAALASNPKSLLPDVILCHQTLEDITGPQCVALLRKHPRLAALPVLSIVGNQSEAEKLRALSVGFSGLLARPYSQTEMRSVLQETTLPAATREELQAACLALETSEFDRALQRYESLYNPDSSPEEAFADGLHSLQVHQWDHAIRAFQRALREVGLKGEAELGLATAWKGKGNLERYRHYLSEAGHTFARASQWHKARTVYARLLREAPAAANPFLTAAERLIRDERYEEAAQALAAGYDISPDKDDMYARLANSCLFTTAPERAANRVSSALGQTPIAPLAADMGEGILQAIGDQARRLEARRRSTERLRAVAEPRVGIELADVAEDGPLTLEPDDDALETLPAAQPASTRPNAASPARRVPHAVASPTRDPEDAPLSVAPLLHQEEAQTNLFSWIPGLNEALTVAKTTWKLHHRSKRNK